MFRLAVCILALVSSVFATQYHSYAVNSPRGGVNLQVAAPSDDQWIARAGASFQLQTTGWDRFWVQTNPIVTDDEVKSYAAGFLEGNLTALQIKNWHYNMWMGDFGGKPPTQSLLRYMKTQIDWTRSVGEEVFRRTAGSPFYSGLITVQVGRYKPLTLAAKDAAFWRQVHYIFNQLQGVLDGYNSAMPDSPLTFMDIYLYGSSQPPNRKIMTICSPMYLLILHRLNSAGDLEDLIGYFAEGKPLHQQAPLAQFKHGKIQTGLDCSAFVKPVSQSGSGFDDIVFGHTTWSQFFSMNRIYKQYNITFADPWVKSEYVAFSSRPAFLSSKDDFYINSAGLGFQETTNSVFNRTLYDLYLVPDQSVLCFQRSIIASRLAASGDVWTYYFSLYNSGTYNNQWMVIDTKRFVPGSSTIQSGLLWIIEQIPGMTQRADVSDIMARQGYWPSYNVPYFEKIYLTSGYNGTCPNGDGSCAGYLSAPRSPLMRRLQPSVVSVDTLKPLMQHNAYLTDPESGGDPAKSISSRYDLRSTKPSPFGGLDSKISSWSLLKNGARNPLTSWAISGPTHQGLPPFSWDDWKNSTVAHVGHPTLWNFDWQPMYNPFVQKN